VRRFIHLARKGCGEKAANSSKNPTPWFPFSAFYPFGDLRFRNFKLPLFLVSGSKQPVLRADFLMRDLYSRDFILFFETFMSFSDIQYLLDYRRPLFKRFYTPLQLACFPKHPVSG